jgi:hypothetical protein
LVAGTAVEALAKRLAFEQLRDDVRHTGESADVVDREDVRMVEGGRARASCSKRRMASTPAVVDPASVLIATTRSSRTSVARYTSPIPPAPTKETMRYGPSWVSGARTMEASVDAIIAAPASTASLHRELECAAVAFAPGDDFATMPLPSSIVTN